MSTDMVRYTFSRFRSRAELRQTRAEIFRIMIQSDALNGRALTDFDRRVPSRSIHRGADAPRMQPPYLRWVTRRW